MTADLGDKPNRRPKTTKFVIFLSSITVLGGLLFGYNTGVVSSAMIFIPTNLHLNYTYTQAVISVALGACAIFSLLAGPCTEWCGRRKTIMLSSFLFAAGALILAAAPIKEILLFGRFIIGAAIGLSSMTVPLYLSETCPAHLRGTMVTAFQLMITFGLLVASVVGALFSSVDPYNTGWRMMFGVAALPAVVMFIGFIYLPESPRYLVGKGKVQDAETVLERVYDGDLAWVVYEMDNIRTAHATLMKDRKEKGGGTWTLIQIFKTPHVRKMFILACALQMFQQLAGVNTLVYYTASVITMSGIRDPSQAIWMSCAVTGVNFVSTFLPLYLVDRLGRRKLLLGSMMGVITALCYLWISFILLNRSSPLPIKGSMDSNGADASSNSAFCNSLLNCDACVTFESCGYCFKQIDSDIAMQNDNRSYGQCLPADLGHSDVSVNGACSQRPAIALHTGSHVWAWNWCPSKYKIMPFIGMMFYLAMFASGLAPMAWVINAEMFPQWARSTGVAWSTCSNWTFNLIISFTFLTLTELITKYGTFFLYSGITIIGFIVMYIYIPETKGKPVEEIELLFMSDKMRETVAAQEREIKEQIHKSNA